VVDSSVAPRLTNTTDAFVYQTAFGTYSLNHSTPFIFTLKSESGVPLTQGSSFFIIANETFTPGVANVITATDSFFEVTYSVLWSKATVGNLTLKMDFYSSLRPKFTIAFARSPSSNFGDYNIVWLTIPVQQWFESGQSMLSAQSISGSVPSTGSSSLEIGPSSDPSSWTDWLTTDWSDAPGGTADVGAINNGGLVGEGQSIIFPPDVSVIDPTQITTSTSTFATAYSTQRKTFSYGGYYFVFYNSGTNILYKSSLDGQSWSTAHVAIWGVGSISSYGFDLYATGSNIALDWLNYNSGSGGDGTTTLYFRRGTAVGGSISWANIATIASLPQPYSWPPAVAIGSDGIFWAGGVWSNSSSHNYYHIWIYRSSDGSAFSKSVDYATSTLSSRYEALQLIPLPQGRLMVLSSHYYDTTIRWRIWNPVSPTGPYWSAIQTVNLNLPANTYKWNLWSATTTPDGNVQMIYQQVNGVTALYYSYYNVTSSSWSTSTAIDSGQTFVYPTLSSDGLGNLYAFYTIQIGSTTYALHYAYRPRGGLQWTGDNSYQPPFGTVTNATWISTGRTSLREVSVLWTQAGSSPNTIFYGSLPLPSGVASSPPGRPWSYAGLSPYEQFFTENGEYVSPGNGLLTISQNDLSVQGRNGLSLSISRIYSQPFTLAQGNPLYYDTCNGSICFVSPYANLANGWGLNLPWVATQADTGPLYLHFLNGELFPLVWTNVTEVVSGDVIATFTMMSHQTEDLVLNETLDMTTNTVQSFKLATKDGMIYNFGGSGLLTSITDRTGQNQLSFSYSGGSLASIADTVGRVATFKYYQTNYLANVTYGGQTVKYGYSGSNLVTVTDAIGRVTTIKYSIPNGWLVSGVVYPQGGNSTYTYGSSVIGTDAVNYYVTLQTVYNPGQVVKSSSFSYNITDGEIKNTSVKQSDGFTVQGFTNYLFNPQSSSLTRTILNGTSVQMMKDQFWYDPVSGRSVQQDTYSGTSLARSFYNSKFYDLWGNVIYTRDSKGHESYTSYDNTNTQYSFQSPGILSTSTNGKRFYDDFINPSLNTTAWTQGGSGLSQSRTVANSNLNLTARSSTSGTWQSNWVRTSGTYSYPFYAEVQMAIPQNPASNTIAAEFVLSPQATSSNGNPFQNNDALLLVLNDGPSYSVQKIVGGTTSTIWSGTNGGTGSVSWKIILTDRNTLSVYLSYGYSCTCFTRVYSTTSLGLSTSFSPSYAYLVLGNSLTTPYSATFDYVGLTGSNSITINSLQAGQLVQLYDWTDTLQATGTVPTGQTSITLNATQLVFPYGYAKIYQVDGRTLQFTSPTREMWGGSTYSYSQPFMSGGDSRTSTGYLQSSTVFVNDNLPSGAVAYSDGGDAWVWANKSFAPVASGSLSHIGFAATGEHEHYFNGSTTTLPATSGYYLVQYVYIPAASIPSEIMMQFHTVSGSWEHRAYWGSNSISWGTNGTASRFYMGPLPALQNLWLELIVKTDDVGVNGLNINGWAYTLYNGGVYWDYSALGTSSTGVITVTNLLAGQKVEVYNSNNALKVSSTVGTGQTSLTLNLYSAGINVFPFRGYLKIYSTSGSVQYSSPLMTDVWGGDAYSYNQPVFSNNFNPGPLSSSIHILQIGSAQYQNATSKPEEEYSNYDSTGNLLQDIRMHNGSNLTTTYTYDTYGNKISSVNPDGEKAYFTYSSTYQHAILTSMTKVLSSTVNDTTSYTYDFPTSYLITQTDPMANSTSYAYDLMGRPTQLTEAPINGSSTHANMAYFDTNKNFAVVNEKGNYTQYVYDGLGRITAINHYQGNLSTPILSSEQYTYDWQGHKKSYTAPDGNVTTYVYDYVGRLVTTTYPDLSKTTTSYNDTSLIQSNYDQNNHRTDLLRDALQRLVGVREYYSSNNYYLTSYTYDAIGNLAKTVDPVGQQTNNTYDDLNRLVLTVFPDGYNQTQVYDNIDNLLSKKDPNGNTISFAYDNLNRLTTTTYPDHTNATFSYDKNNNLVHMTNSNATANFVYDSRNRLTGESWTIPGVGFWSITPQYDAAGNMIRMTYPDATTVNFSFDPLNRIVGAKTGTTTLATISYAIDSTVKTITYGNGVVTTYSYNAEKRPTRIKTVLGSSTLLDLNYTYDPVGNVLGINTESYSYDSLNRLTYSSGPWGVLRYGYDGAGNRLWASVGGTNTTYTYGAYDRLSSIGSTSNTYDNDGNLKTQTTASITNSYSYDFENRLTKVGQGGSTLGAYAYSAKGQRIEKTEGGVTTVYENQGVNVLWEDPLAGVASDYVYAAGLLIAKITSGNIFYFHQDKQGNTRLVTQGSSTSFSSNYQPFGPQYGASGTDPTYKYTEKPQDAATGLYYYGARYYDGSTGRFLSRDPSSPAIREPQSLNPYEYARENPETFTDPTGMSTIPGSPNDTYRFLIKTALDAAWTAIVALAWSPVSDAVVTLILGATIWALQSAYGGEIVDALISVVVVSLDNAASNSFPPLSWLLQGLSFVIENATLLLLGSTALKIKPLVQGYVSVNGVVIGLTFGFLAVDAMVDIVFDYFGWLCDLGCGNGSGGIPIVSGGGTGSGTAELKRCQFGAANSCPGWTLRWDWNPRVDIGINSRIAGAVPI
jgi:RHS repeat-associated protein